MSVLPSLSGTLSRARSSPGSLRAGQSGPRPSFTSMLRWTSATVTACWLPIRYRDRRQLILVQRAGGDGIATCSTASGPMRCRTTSSYSTDSSARNRPRLLPALLRDATSHPNEYRLTKAPILVVAALKTLEANYPWLRTTEGSAARQQAQLYLDRVLNPWYMAGARRLQQERVDAEVLSIPGHHFIFITAQQRVAQAVLQFLGHLPH